MVKRLDEGMLRRPAQIMRSCQASPEQFQALNLRRSAIARPWSARRVSIATPLARLVMRGPVLATDVSHCFPTFEFGFDCQKISGLAVVGVLLDGSASPCEPTTACRANGIFRENLRQCVCELAIECRNVGT